MEQIICKFEPIFVEGYIETTLPSEIFTKINNDVSLMRGSNFQNAEKFNKHLAGAIEHEYALDPTNYNHLQKFIDIISKQFVEATKQYDSNYKKSIINNLWVNFQKKYEYNPMHTHAECDLSFVSWLNIPYDIEEEMNLPHIVNSSNFTSGGAKLNFIFNRPNGGIQIESYSPTVGKLLLFNSKLHHEVHPFFTSDDYRISIAGNIRLVYE